MAPTVCGILQLQSLLNNFIPVADSLLFWGNFMKFEDFQTISSQKSCAIFTAVDLPIANVLATLQKEFPVAKRQSATPTCFSTGIAFRKLLSCFSKFGRTRATGFQDLHYSYENLAPTWFEVH